MKTLVKTRTEFETRIKVLGSNKELIILHTGISEDTYNLLLFETGCQLLENFFADLDVGMKDLLMYGKKGNYWSWYKMQWTCWEMDFWAASSWIVLEAKDAKFFKNPHSESKLLLNEWKSEMGIIPSNRSMHERLHHHIIQNDYLV